MPRDLEYGRHRRRSLWGNSNGFGRAYLASEYVWDKTKGYLKPAWSAYSSPKEMAVAKRKSHASHYKKSAGKGTSKRRHTLGGPPKVKRSSKTSSKKEERIHGDDVHSGITSTGYVVSAGKKFPKGFLKSPRIHLDETYSGLNQGSVGLQSVFCIAEIGTYTQAYGQPLAPSITPNLGTNFWLSTIRYLDLVPTTVVQNPTYFTTTNEASLEKIILKNCLVNVELTNGSVGAAAIDVYVLQARRDAVRPVDTVTAGQFLAASAPAKWTQFLAQEGFHATTGTRSGAVPYVGSSTQVLPYSTPSECLEFSKYYKIAKVHHINMAAGATETVHFDLKMNKVFDYAKDAQRLQFGASLSNQTSTADLGYRLQLAVGGYTIMVVARGQPVIDTLTSLPSYSSTNILWCVTKKMKFGLMKANAKKFATVQAFDDMDTLAGLAQQKLVNILDADVGLTYAS